MEFVHPNVEYVMITAEQIEKRVKELAKQMDTLYKGRNQRYMVLQHHKTALCSRKFHLAHHNFKHGFLRSQNRQ